MVARAFRWRVAISNVIAQKDFKEKRAPTTLKNATQCHANTVERVVIRLALISK